MLRRVKFAFESPFLNKKNDFFLFRSPCHEILDFSIFLAIFLLFSDLRSAILAGRLPRSNFWPWRCSISVEAFGHQIPIKIHVVFLPFFIPFCFLRWLWPSGDLQYFLKFYWLFLSKLGRWRNFNENNSDGFQHPVVGEKGERGGEARKMQIVWPGRSCTLGGLPVWRSWSF